MGNYRQTNKDVDNTKLPRLYPEPDYVIKTRAPCHSFSWQTNMNIRIKEEELADEAMPLARRKCFEPVMEYLACEEREGSFWMVFNCQEDWFYASECLEFEFHVEMDKKRRDMDRNKENFWRALYNADGEVGKQKEMKYGQLGLWDSVKFTFLGEEYIKEEAYKYPKPEWFQFYQNQKNKKKQSKVKIDVHS